MDAKQIVRELVSIANTLDQMGFSKEADQVDGLIKTAQASSWLKGLSDLVGKEIGVDPGVMMTQSKNKLIWDVLKRVVGNDPTLLRKLGPLGGMLEDTYTNTHAADNAVGVAGSPDSQLALSKELASQSMQTIPGTFNNIKNTWDNIQSGQGGGILPPGVMPFKPNMENLTNIVKYNPNFSKT